MICTKMLFAQINIVQHKNLLSQLLKNDQSSSNSNFGLPFLFGVCNLNIWLEFIDLSVGSI